MSFTVNQYNYATPPISASESISGSYNVPDKKYFSLHNNVLDGSFYPIEGDAGIWSASLSDDNGILSTPLILTVQAETSVNAFRITGSSYSFPVAFLVELYNGSDLVLTISEDNNNTFDYVKHLDSTVAITGYIVTVTKISAANDTLKLYCAYNPAYVKRSDTLSIIAIPESIRSDNYELVRRDKLDIYTNEARSSVMSALNPTADVLRISSLDKTYLANVHTRMKDLSRKVYGKVYITYTDPMRAIETTFTSSPAAHNSEPTQVLDGDSVVTDRYFTLYDNDLSGSFIVSEPSDQVGWTSAAISDANGYFSDPPYLRIDFAERPVTGLPVVFDDSHGVIVNDFTVEVIRADGTSLLKEFVGNTSKSITIDEYVAQATTIIVTVTKINTPYYPVTILDIPITSTFLYVGYKDKSELMSIGLLEELTYDDDVEALGGISANEITVMLDNSSRNFYFNNRDSMVSTSLTRNRKIEPWLGVEISPGIIEWYALGTFWSYSWDVPAESLIAKVVGFDTLGFLDKTTFTEHYMQVNKSIGQLVEYVLNDARRQYDFVTYKIDPALYDIIIPYAWFDPSSHTAALRKISGCFPVHIYCDRTGTICAAPQKLELDHYRDVWSDSTNVISKKYKSLFTALPNVINVMVRIPVIVNAQELVVDDFDFDIAHFPTRTLNFGNPYISGLSVTVDCDSTVRYSYSAYSWGIVFNFFGVGKVHSISCSGNVVDVSRNATVTRRDEAKIRLNGAITRNIQSDFIQTSDLANELLNRLSSLSEFDKFDVDIVYRGDISLSINDPILLLDGVAPDNRYNIKRHELFWNGALSGSAHLNT